MPLSYDTLHSSTLALVKSYNKNAGRFDPPVYEALHRNVLMMREMYLDNVRQKPEKSAEANLSYLKAIDSITHLARQLPKVTRDSPEYIQQHNILLGALYYRYLIVKESYTKKICGRFFSLIGAINIENTALYTTLKNLLNISLENVIDGLSISLCCKAYLEYLESLDKCENTGYIPECEKKEFFDNLRSKIKEFDVESVPLLQSIKYVDVIQWVDGLLCAIDEDMESAIKSWCEVMSNQQNKFPLSRQDIIGCMSDVKSAPSFFVRVLLDYLLLDDATFEEDDSVSKYKETLDQRFSEYKKSVLQGIYALTLAQLASKYNADRSLVKTLNTAIEGAQEGNGIALVALDHFFKNVKLSDIPDSLCCVWGSFPEFLDELRDEIATTEFPPGEEDGPEEDMVCIGF